MPLLDIQQRFRELGRIRTGVKEDTGKVYEKGPNKGKPIMRPVKLPRFRLTSPAKHLVEACAEQFGGVAAQWDNDGAAEWEVIIEVAELPILIAPGEIFNQWYELWSGGGCLKRCDGKRQVLKDAACTCPKDPEERSAEAAKGKACKPTTRLNVMLPDIPDLGVWRLESHGYYAAVELAPAAGLCEVATRRGAMIPADLRLVAREGARRPGEVRKKFFVPAISFRGALAPVLEALGMDTGGPALMLATGVGPRPALDAGGRAALPAAAPSSFVPGEQVEEAKVPPAGAPPLPDKPFEPPLGGTSDEPGGAASEMSRAQIIAMRCRDHGIDRAHIIEAITSARQTGSVTSGNDVTAEEASELFLAVVKVKRGQQELVETRNGWRLINPGAAYDAPDLPEEPVKADPPPDESTHVDEPPDEPETPVETVTPDAVIPPVPPSSQSFDDVGDEDQWSADQWRAYLQSRQVKVTEAIKEAQRLASETDGVDPPGNLSALKGQTSLCSLLRGWAEEMFEQRAGS